ncbi:glycosyltransferase family 2 protein [Thermocoleostomius sinensis]|uniref:Glycosyltransferase family 2 protein n=1 Tax=Thermocoleostomius sinensis A174 TaxID=2016057 RepID=A0A9E9C696_9CYAN|nr:glycosyltransferase family 2 protein [Thermocoleostomius sinensis]WAL62041.1 glycosyltransferase family 2 protein [Thermocoleostomius sinensis A174]
MKLSVIIPVYNEIHTIDSTLIEVVKALPHVSKEIVIVDDGSTDGTREWLTRTLQTHTSLTYLTLNANQQLIALLDNDENNQENADVTTMDISIDKAVDHTNGTITTLNAPIAQPILPVAVTVLWHDRNQGKGAALRSGFQAATGDVLVIQDADLEYTPQDWGRMWQLIADGRADVVYGSRFYGEPHRVLYFHHLLGNKAITTLTNLLCNTTFTDIEVCYKMFRCEVLQELTLTCNDFGFEVEFTVKMSRSPRKWRLYEAGISYYGRTYEEGKKINWRDGLKALWYVVRFRFAS